MTIGRRRYRATIKQHDGTVDSHGGPSYTTAGDWDTVVSSWPCEILTVSGNEKLAGRQLDATTTHVFKGDYHAVSTVVPTMRAECNGVVYGIVAVYDPDGLRREMQIEAKVDR